MAYWDQKRDNIALIESEVRAKMIICGRSSLLYCGSLHAFLVFVYTVGNYPLR